MEEMERLRRALKKNTTLTAAAEKSKAVKKDFPSSVGICSPPIQLCYLQHHDHVIEQNHKEGSQQCSYILTCED